MNKYQTWKQREYFLRYVFVLFMLLFFQVQAHAQKILFLSTNSSPNPDRSVPPVAANILKEFGAIVGANNITHIDNLQQANAINAGTFGEPNEYGLVIALRLNSPEWDPSNLTVFNEAVQNRRANAFALFNDTGGNSNNNAARDLQATLLNAAGFSFTPSGAQAQDVVFELNANSIYKASFSEWNPIRGGYFFYMNNVPAEYVLYTRQGALPPPSGLVNDVYTVIIPAAESYKMNGPGTGQGACIIATSDASMFEERNYSGTNPENIGPNNNTGVTNVGKVAKAYLKAVSASGACGLPSISKSYEGGPDIYLGGDGNKKKLTITLSNSLLTPATGAALTDILPEPLLIDGGLAAVSTTCTGGNLDAVQNAEGQFNGVKLVGASIPPGSLNNDTKEIAPGTCTITVPVIWPNTETGRTACTGTTTLVNLIPSGSAATPGGNSFTTTQGQTGTAQASLTCHPGKLTVRKSIVFNPPALSSGVDLTASKFNVEAVCTGSDSVEVRVPGEIQLDTPTSGSVTLTPVISEGVCVVTETSRASAPTAPLMLAWNERDMPSISLELAQPVPGTEPPFGTITNTLVRQTASIALQKIISGGPSTGLSSVGTFDFTASCGVDGVFPGSVNVAQGAAAGAGAIANVPVGANCLVAEGPVAAVAPLHYQWDRGALPASVEVAVQQSGNSATFTNVLVRQMASVVIRTTITGGPASGFTGTFGYSLNCGADGSFSPRTVSASTTSAGTVTIGNVPQGANCRVTQTDTPDAPSTYQWGAAPAAVMREIGAEGNTFEFPNALNPGPTATIQLQKLIVGGPAAGLEVDGKFGFTATCDVGGPFSSQVTVAKGASSGSGSMENVPVGAKCSVSEEPIAAVAPSHYQWGALPGSVSVTVAQSGNVAALTNTLTRQVASLVIRTTITGGPAGGFNGAFGYAVNCGVDGSFGPHTVSASSAAAGTVTVDNVPQGASCTVTQTDTPGAPSAYQWGTAPAPVTLEIAANGTTFEFANVLRVPVVDATPVPSSNAWTLAMLACLLASMAAWQVRSQRRR